jgi:hypothetical protein
MGPRHKVDPDRAISNQQHRHKGSDFTYNNCVWVYEAPEPTVRAAQAFPRPSQVAPFSACAASERSERRVNPVRGDVTRAMLPNLQLVIAERDTACRGCGGVFTRRSSHSYTRSPKA